MLIPSIFRNIPPALAPADPPATAVELSIADSIRQRYLVPGQPEPYMTDVVRAMRVLRGAGRYAEIGTRDRGNIAYMATVLASNPVIVDVDLERLPESERMIAQELAGRADYTFFHGDSVDPAVVTRVAQALGPERADGIFCDSSHMYEHTLAEFEMYWPLIRPGGFLMYHDACWEGNTMDKGKYQALAVIDREVPVWLVVQDEPVHRLLPRSRKGDFWGTIAVIPKPFDGL
jgi:predicted O-methyltransferase YrrM